MNTFFDFDAPIDRTLTDSYKWQKYGGRDIIPMWVADMDFPSPPAVMEALHERIDHGIFGYPKPSESLKEIIAAHLLKNYGWAIDTQWLIWLPGLVSGLNVACRSVGGPDDGVLTTIPVYPPFLTAPKFSGKKLHTSEMVFADNRWQTDLDDLKKNHGSDIALFLLCNPQNPTGRSFTRQELENLAEICFDHDWTICSDEIHCDLILEPAHRHIPLASIGPDIQKKTITLMSPSKTFNIPGLGCAFAIISDDRLRRRFVQAMAGIVPHVTIFGFVAAQAAYQHGWPWLKALLDYLRANRELVYQAVAKMPGLIMGPVEATYLAWIDARPAGLDHPIAFFEQNGVGLSNGADFGAPGYARLNFGCPRRLLSTALARMARSLT